MAHEMTLDRYLEANRETADPKILLDLVLAESERVKVAVAAREHEYKIASEVTLDDKLNPQPKTLAQLFRAARMYVDGGLVPDAYFPKEGKETFQPVPAVAIGIQAAKRCGVDALTFLQCSFPHKGKIGIESKLAIAMLINSGKIEGRPGYSFETDKDGQVTSCTCSVLDKESGEEKSQTVTWENVTKEGWDRPKGTQPSKWVTLRKLMFQYRSGIFVMRVHYPEVLLGHQTIEEFEDIERADMRPTTSMADLEARFGMPANGDVEHLDNSKAFTTKQLEDRSASDVEQAEPEISAPKKRGRPKKSESAPASQELLQSSQPAGNKLPFKSGAFISAWNAWENFMANTIKSPITPEKATRNLEYLKHIGEERAVKTLVHTIEKGLRVLQEPAVSTRKPAKGGEPTKEPTTEPSHAKASPAASKALAVTPAVIQQLYGDKCEDFDLEAISAEAAQQGNKWSAWLKDLIGRKLVGWENFLLENTKSVADTKSSENQDGINQDGINQDEELPVCIVCPVVRPEGMPPAVIGWEKELAKEKSPSKLKATFSVKIQGNPDLTDEEAIYLKDLFERRLWYAERGQDAPEEEQIPW